MKILIVIMIVLLLFCEAQCYSTKPSTNAANRSNVALNETYKYYDFNFTRTEITSYPPLVTYPWSFSSQLLVYNKTLKHWYIASPQISKEISIALPSSLMENNKSSNLIKTDPKLNSSPMNNNTLNNLIKTDPKLNSPPMNNNTSNNLIKTDPKLNSPLMNNNTSNNLEKTGPKLNSPLMNNNTSNNLEKTDPKLNSPLMNNNTSNNLEKTDPKRTSSKMTNNSGFLNILVYLIIGVLAIASIIIYFDTTKKIQRAETEEAEIFKHIKRIKYNFEDSSAAIRSRIRYQPLPRNYKNKKNI